MNISVNYAIEALRRAENISHEDDKMYVHAFADESEAVEAAHLNSKITDLNSLDFYSKPISEPKLTRRKCG